MNKSLLSRGSSWVASLLALTLVCACSTTSTSPSQSAAGASAAAAGSASGGAQKVLPNGLHLVSETSQRILYVRPGANFAKYTKVQILPCFVAMQSGWQENYNAQASSLDQMVTDSDVQNIKNILANQFKQVFTTELTRGGYKVVDQAGPDVLLLRPALVNVTVTAPDPLNMSNSETVVRSAGSAKLFLELWDPTTKTILARVIDAQADQQVQAQAMTSVTNQEAADAILKTWADNLVKHLDAAKTAARA
jgi:hypothetical protein